VAPDAVSRGREGRFAVGRHVPIAGHEVDDAEEGARTVEDRSRAAHHLDAVDVVDVDHAVVADVRGPDVVVVQRVAVEHHQDAVAVVARATEPAHADGVVAAIVRQINAADAAHGFGDGRIGHGAKLLRGDDGDRRGRVLHALTGTRRGGDFLQRRQLHLQFDLLILPDVDDLLDRAKSALHHAHAVIADRHVEHRGREAARLIVDRDERIAHVGVHHHVAGLRHELGVHHDGLARRDVDHRLCGLKAFFGHQERVATGRRLHVAGHQARDRSVLAIEAHLRPGRRSLDADGAQDLHQFHGDRHLFADLKLDVGLRGLVARELDHHLVLTGGETERTRRIAAWAEIFAIDEDGRPRRIGGHTKDGHRGGQTRQGLLHALPCGGRALALQRLHVVAVGVGGLLELLVGTRDVEEHVLVRHQPIRREKVLERGLVVARFVFVGRDLEVQIGFVGEIVGSRDARREAETNRQRESGGAKGAREADHGGVSSVVRSSGCFERGRSS